MIRSLVLTRDSIKYYYNKHITINRRPIVNVALQQAVCMQMPEIYRGGGACKHVNKCM